MTRICSTCKKVMGWKCVRCGTNLTDCSGLGHFGWCQRCTSIRGKKAGGITHGICNECEGKVKEGVG